ncbi:hypothetical protein GCM10008922_12690 [Faecalicatena contorta]|uniref:hypothetical protein n=1 Tax=Faecalicatena contorta TaxID=39482 RepID=UPI00290DC6EE|nr:hypothetical protein [Clostridium sp.]
MKLFRNIDEKLESIGFVKVSENEYGANFERVNKKYNYTQCVDLLHKVSGAHIIQSYDKDLMDEENIGNTCVGLTYFELKLFMRKMKQIGLDSNMILVH